MDDNRSAYCVNFDTGAFSIARFVSCTIMFVTKKDDSNKDTFIPDFLNMIT